MMLLGSDYSKHNGDNGVVDSDQFVILRAGYGRCTTDKQLVNNITKCVEKGIPFGLYWFSYAYDVDSARQEAYQLCTLTKNLKAYGAKPEFPLYYDNEYDSNKYFKKIRGRAYTKSEYNAMCKRFCECVENFGFYAGIYLNKDYFSNWLDDENKERFSLWLADYNGKDNAFVGKHKNVHVVQYANVPWDKNISRVNFPEVIKKAKLNGW